MKKKTPNGASNGEDLKGKRELQGVHDANSKRVEKVEILQLQGHEEELFGYRDS